MQRAASWISSNIGGSEKAVMAFLSAPPRAMRRAADSVGSTAKMVLPNVVIAVPPTGKRLEYWDSRLKKALERLDAYGAAEQQELSRAVEAAKADRNWQGSNAHVMSHVASLFLEGRDVEKDPKRAFELYKRNMDVHNHQNSKLMVAQCLQRGGGTEVDLKQAIQLYEQLAAKEDKAAQYMLGTILCTDKGADVGHPQDLARALDLFMRAAHAGFPPAICAAAEMMATGQGTEKDERRAVEWLKIASNMGFNRAVNLLGEWQQTKGLDIDDDLQQIHQHLLNAANIGAQGAQLAVGLNFLKGRGVEKNYSEAFKWLNQAYEQHLNTEAMILVAEMLAQGRGTKKNLPRALAMYQEAARSGATVQEGVIEALEAKVRQAGRGRGRGSVQP